MKAERKKPQNNQVQALVTVKGGGDFVTEKEIARRCGQSGDLVWMWVCLWR